MKRMIAALAALAIVAAAGLPVGPAAAGAASAGIAAPEGTPELSRKARSALERLTGRGNDGRVVVVRWHDTLATPAELTGSIGRPTGHSPVWIAYAFLEETKELYGLSKPSRDMRVAEVRPLEGGGAEVSFRHMLYGRPVWGDELVVRVERDGVISRVAGTVHPRLERRTFHRRVQAALSESEAGTIAATFADALGVPVGRAYVSLGYDPTRAGVPLVYAVTFETAASGGKPAVVLVHAMTGRVIP